MIKQKKLKTLLVEDNKMIVIVHTAMLEELNINPDIAISGSEAVLKAQKNSYDLIFMDIGLPDIDGIEATQRIRALEQANNKSRAAIIGLTACSIDDVKLKCLAAGMYTVVNKPISQSGLIKLINKYGRANKLSTLSDQLLFPIKCSSSRTINC